jgi:hypothetical protein
MQRKTKYRRRYALNNLKLHLHCQTPAIYQRPSPLAFSALCAPVPRRALPPAQFGEFPRNQTSVLPRVLILGKPVGPETGESKSRLPQPLSMQEPWFICGSPT